MTAQTVTCNQNADDVGFLFAGVANAATTAMSSTGGNTTWTARTLSSSANWNGLCYGDGFAMAVAANAATAIAIDGFSWLSFGSIPSGTAWIDCDFGNHTFVAVNQGTTTAAYCNPLAQITWTTVSTLPAAVTWTAVKFVSYSTGVFFAVASGTAQAARSTDNGANWDSITMPSSGYSVLGSGNGKLVAIVPSSTKCAVSSDGGSNWTEYASALPSSAAWAAITYANGIWVATASSGSVAAYSTNNGQSWSSATMPASANWKALTAGKSALDGRYIFIAAPQSATGGAFSYDGATWFSFTCTSAAWNKLAWFPVQWMSADTVTINNGATLTVNTDQKRFWNTITITNGTLNITNSSTSTPIKFGMGRTNATAARHTITPGSGLGLVTVQGNWIEIGTSSGAAGQTFTSPYSDGDYIPALWVETGSGTGVYEVWVNVTGMRDYDIFNTARNGLRAVGNGAGGTCFTQDGDQTAVQYVAISGIVTKNNSNVVKCTSTTGLKRGMWVTARSLPATAVIQDVIDSTTFTINSVVTTGISTYNNGIAIYPLSMQYSTTLRFGDGVNGKIPPSGAKIRIPNILITDYTSARFIGTWSSSNTPACFIGSSGGQFTFDTCLFGESYGDYSQSNKVSFTNVGFCYIPFVSECYQLTMTNVGCALPPVVQYTSAATALGATGSTTLDSATVTIPSSTAIIPGTLLTGTNLQGCTVSTVGSDTSLTLSQVAFGTATGTVAFTYYNNWTPRDYRALQSTTAGAYGGYSSIQYTYVSNASLTNVVIAWGGYIFIGSAGTLASTINTALSMAYSNDVTLSKIKALRLGMSARNRAYEAGMVFATAGNNIAVSDSDVFNTNVAALANVSNVTFDDVNNRHGINNEGYNFAAGFRAYKNPATGADLSTYTSYWLKTRSYRAHDFHETGGYVDSMPVCANFTDSDDTYHRPKFFAASPYYMLSKSPTVAYGSGVWVSLVSGAPCAIVSGDNGSTWSVVQLPALTTWWKVIWTGSLFVAIGGGTAASTLAAMSSDGYRWYAPNTAPASATWQALAYDSAIATNKLVAVAGGGTAGTVASYSADNGITWSAATLSASATWIDVASSGAGRFVAIAGGAAATASSYSTNGNTWTAGGALASSAWQALAYGAGLFVAISSSAVNGPTSRSSDGTSWTAGTAPSLPAGQNWCDIFWTGSVFVILSGPIPLNIAAPGSAFSQAFATSSDGITWSSIQYLPDFTYWFAGGNNGNAALVVATTTDRCCYTADITVATPTWSLYTTCVAVWNRIAWDRRDPGFTPSAPALAAVATTAGSNSVTCTSTAALFVGALVNLPSVIPSHSFLLGATYATPAARVSGITNATTFTTVEQAVRTASGLAPNFYKHVYQLFRDTNSGFSPSASKLIATTATATNLFFDDADGLSPNTPYYYILRKLNGYGTLANCSGSAGSTTITTSGNFNAWVTGVGYEGLNGSTVLFSRYQNFYSLGIVQGCKVSGTGIPANTIVNSVDDYNQITLSNALTQDVIANTTTINFSPAVGMWVYGSNVGDDAKVQSIDSNTSMTVTVSNTNAFTNQTLTFVSGTESPTLTCIPTPPIVVQNNLFQSNTLATSPWTNTNNTVTNAAVSCPFDDIFGVATATTTGCTIRAAAANGTSSQTVYTGVGSTYRVSIWARARLPDNKSYITLKCDWGTSTATWTLTNKWTRYYLDFTATANTTVLTFTLAQRGAVIEVAYGMVTLGALSPVAITPTTTTAGVLLPQQNWSITTTAMGAAGWSEDGAGSGIELNLLTAPTGQKWAHIHLGTAYNFTISDANQIFSTESTAVTEAVYAATTAASNITIKNYAPVSTGGASQGFLLNAINGAANILFKSSSFYINGSAGYLCNLAPAYNVKFRDIDVYNPRNFITAVYADSVTTNNNAKDLELQNVRFNRGRFPWANQMLNSSFKGVGGANTKRLTTAVVWNLSSSPTYDSLPIASTAVYDTMFHEMTFDSGTDVRGCLHLNMVASSKAVKPYTFTAGNPFFDNSGKLYLQTAGDQVVIEWPHFIIGLTSFERRLPHIYGVDLGVDFVTQIGALVEYDLDMGAGYSGSWKRLTANCDNLANESGWNQVIGVRPKFRITARKGLKYTGQSSNFVVNETIGNATSSPTATFQVLEDEDEGTVGTLIVGSVTGEWSTANTMYSGATTRATITAVNGFVFFPQNTSYIAGIRIFARFNTTYKYPVESATVTITGSASLSGAEIRIYDLDGAGGTDLGTELAGVESNGSSSFAYTGTPGNDIWIQIMKTGYEEFGQRYTIPTADASFYALLTRDLNA